MNKDNEIARLTALVQEGLAVVEDFMPFIGKCALQDYARLNHFVIEAQRLRLDRITVSLHLDQAAALLHALSTHMEDKRFTPTELKQATDVLANAFKEWGNS